MFAGAAAALAAIGLVGGLQMAGHGETTNTQAADSTDRAQTYTVTPQQDPAPQVETPTVTTPADDLTDGTLGLSEHSHDTTDDSAAWAVPSTDTKPDPKVKTTAVRPVVIHKHAPAPANADSAADKPATTDKPVAPKDDKKKIHLGVADVSVGDGGLLGLVKVEKPADPADKSEPTDKSGDKDKSGSTPGGATGSSGLLGGLTSALPGGK
jgi:hypothetical protein